MYGYKWRHSPAVKAEGLRLPDLWFAARKRRATLNLFAITHLWKIKAKMGMPQYSTCGKKEINKILISDRCLGLEDKGAVAGLRFDGKIVLAEGIRF
jgi:hypothetical protein